MTLPRIPLKPATFGRQYAGWTPRAVAHDGLGSRMLPDQRVPVDGAVLHADVYTPETPGRYPAVVAFGGYNTDWHTAGIPTGSNEIGSPPVFTDRGYCPVIVERRGMGRSTGERVMFFSEQDTLDFAAVIAWAAEQPWCSGEVVLFGTSYYGMTQLQVAALRPPALKGFFCNEICTDPLRQIFAFGGVPGSFFLALWLGANFTDARDTGRMAPNVRALLSHVTNGPLHPLLERLVHRNIGTMFDRFMHATPDAEAREIFTRWVFDEKTREETTVPPGATDGLVDIEVPFVVVQNLGYLNLHQFGCYDLVEHASTPAEKQWMILGPPEYALPVYSWQGEALAFFDHLLHGTDNGYDAQPRVRYWVDGDDGFTTAPSFPPPAHETVRLHLAPPRPDGGSPRLGTEVPEAGTASWVAVPRGVPVVGGLEETANQVLTFELPVVEDLHLAGPVTARLTFSCNEIDSYVLARLSRVDTAGRRHQLSMGAMRPVARREDPTRSTPFEIVLDHGHREPLVPGEPVVLRFSLTPFPVRLRAGERLRLDLGSRTDLLRMDPGDGYVQFDMPVPPYLCRNTVHLGGESWIEVTRVGEGS